MRIEGLKRPAAGEFFWTYKKARIYKKAPPPYIKNFFEGGGAFLILIPLMVDFVLSFLCLTLNELKRKYILKKNLILLEKRLRKN